MSLAAGRLRHRVRIEERVELLDSNGEVIQDDNTGAIATEWQLVAEVSAAIEPLSAKEFIAAQATQSQVSARVVIRHRDGLNAAMRLVHMVNGVAGRIYNIHGILTDRDSGLEYLTIPVSEGVSDSGQ